MLQTLVIVLALVVYAWAAVALVRRASRAERRQSEDRIRAADTLSRRRRVG